MKRIADGIQYLVRIIDIVRVGPAWKYLLWMSQMMSLAICDVLGIIIGCLAEKAMGAFVNLPPTLRIPRSSKNGLRGTSSEELMPFGK